ncbi:carboxymuconolactone decarboxylase family protein [Pseudoalteromonas piscicida]|uniref:Alkylhydroperoxidase n=1 Tax=Pseudoalteromonas piscicida TaxID=43662 RepID=A0A2A5JRY0_PSEO7|nr:carboxymuconolactone decarboxylase family protein [Pseudoalteromonas piscicida]PCK32156.1 alkylhydroperoxidase [Pseudoalteromonas piscicida]
MKRADYFNQAPELIQHLLEQEELLKQQAGATFGITIWELVKLRASQLNQCAFCIAMHTKQAIEQGETSNRIIGLSAWRDMQFYTVEESKALELCEKLTNAQSIDDTFYHELSALFDDKSLTTLTIAINAINSWNRVVKMFKPKVEFNDS